ncbi:TPA: hypothetical protein ACH3X1_009745 [Trebouxia sp. C0004]
MPCDVEISTLKLYWKNIVAANEGLQLPSLALLLLDIKPHAADPEKTVSLMGWYHSSRRSQLLSSTTTAMTTIKMHHQTVKDRAVKPLRDLEEIMTNEQRLAADVDKAEADDRRRQAAEKDKPTAATMAVAGPSDLAELEEQLTAVTSTVNSADAMELCSTSEITGLFAEYYESDCKEFEGNYMLNDKSTNTDIDFNHPALAGNGGVASSGVLARAVVGSSNDHQQFDILNVISE